jgi:hypothetical protein
MRTYFEGLFLLIKIIIYLGVLITSIYFIIRIIKEKKPILLLCITSKCDYFFAKLLLLFFILFLFSNKIPAQILGAKGAVYTVMDVDAKKYLDSAGINNITQRIAINRFVKSVKAQGLWNNIVSMWPLMGTTGASMKWNLKSVHDADTSFRLTYGGSTVLFSADGMQTGTTTGYANTYCTPASVTTPKNFTMGLYANNTMTASSVGMGSIGVTSNNTVFGTAWTGGAWPTWGATACDVGTLNVQGSSKGLIIISSNATRSDLYKNGNFSGYQAYHNYPLSTYPMYLGSWNNHGTSTTPSKITIKFAFVAKTGMSATQVKQLSDDINTLQQSLGRNEYFNNNSDFYYYNYNFKYKETCYTKYVDYSSFPVLAQNKNMKFGATKDTLFFSTNNGSSYPYKLNRPLKGVGNDIVFGYIFKNGNIIFATWSNHIYHSLDSLKTVQEIYLTKTNGGNFWYASTNGGFYNYLNQFEPDSTYNDMFVAGSYANAGSFSPPGNTQINIIYSSDHGNTIKIAYRFGPSSYLGIYGDTTNSIFCKHVHCVTFQPKDTSWWCVTGDADNNSDTAGNQWLKGKYKPLADTLNGHPWTWVRKACYYNSDLVQATAMWFTGDSVVYIAELASTDTSRQGLWTCSYANITNFGSHRKIYHVPYTANHYQTGACYHKGNLYIISYYNNDQYLISIDNAKTWKTYATPKILIAPYSSIVHLRNFFSPDQNGWILGSEYNAHSFLHNYMFKLDQ